MQAAIVRCGQLHSRFWQWHIFGSSHSKRTLRHVSVDASSPQEKWTPSELLPVLSAQPPYKILFMGTDDVSLETLRRLHQDMTTSSSPLISEMDVITPGERRVGRTPKTALPVKHFANENSLPVYEIPPTVKSLKKWDTELFDANNTNMYDFGVAVSFGYFVNKAILKKLRWGAINMHPSLLPHYRGAAPIHHVLLDDQRRTGVSVIEIHPEQFDSGKILAQCPVSIYETDSYATLRERLSVVGADLVLQTIKDLPRKVRNSSSQAQFIPPGKELSDCPAAPKIMKEMRSFELNGVSSRTLFNRVRALAVNPGLAFMLHPQSVRVKILSVAPPLDDKHRPDIIDGQPCLQELPKCFQNQERAPEGTLQYDRVTKSLWVKTADGWLQILKIQVQQRRAKSGKVFASDIHMTSGAKIVKLTKAE